jgi:hypothetical protein
MAKQKALAGAAHDIAHHAASGLSYLSPHMAQALRSAGITTTTIELLDASPYPAGATELKPLRLALQSLSATAVKIIAGYGLPRTEVSSVRLSVTPAPWDSEGYSLHTRAEVTAGNGRTYDSGWLQ